MSADLSKKIDDITVSRSVSAEAYEQRRTTFFELADRFQKATDPTEIERLRDELAKMTFGV